ncbi:MAG: leucine-rich repeat protein, partial [Bacteroidaceae bacterium]|nr:leucine-rich repeat protein [Bacteroidaceae bacterium]
MKTTYKTRVFALVSGVILSAGAAFADDFEVDGLNYSTVSDTEVMVTGGSASGAIVIPATVSNANKPYTVVTVSGQAFYSRHDITSVTFPRTLKRIEGHAFYDNYYMQELHFSEGLEEIGPSSFAYMGNDSQVTYTGELKLPNSVKTIGYTAFRSNHTVNIEELDLPKSLEYIGYEAFHGLSNKLKTIKLYENVTYIGNAAFYDLSTVDEVFISAPTPPSMPDGDAFSGISDHATLYVDKNALSAYQNADYWKDFASIQTFSPDEGFPCSKPLFSFNEEEYILSLRNTNEGATIYYTTDGSDPTTSSTKYTEPFMYFGNQTIKAIAVCNGYSNSAVATYERFDLPTPAPIVSMSEDFIVTMKDIAPDTKIYWSTDASVTYGWGDEYNMSISKLYEGAFTLTQATHIYAFAVRDGWSNSAFVDANFFDDYYVNTPDIYDEVASDNSYKTITIVSNYDGATIYYTLDGSDPNTSATRKEYTEPFKLDHNLTVKAISTFPGRINSPIAERYIDGIDSRFKKDGIYYRQIDNSVNNEVEVTSGDSGYSGEITIPQTVTNGGTTFNVLRIGDNAFYNQDNLTAISLPNTILSIGQHAFQNCDGLKSVNIPGSVKALEYEAFRECHNMEKVTFNEGLESIDYAVFYDNNNLKELVLPSTLKAIGVYAFGRCHSATKCALPDGVETIGSLAFINCGALSSINLPNSIKEIGANCFERCSALQSIKLPSSLSVIRSFLFNECRELVSVEIPASVQEIQNEAFRYCEKLASIVIPEGVTTIPYGCFTECYALASVSLPSTITTIDQYAFNNDRSLPTITLPASLTSIGYDAFQGNSSLKAVYLFATTPPTFTDNNALLGAAQQGATLYVPAEAVETYKNARSWQEFDPNIAAIGNLPAAQPTFFFENYTLTMSTLTDGAVIYYSVINNQTLKAIAPMANEEAWKGRATQDIPADNWMNADFDDSSWSEQKAALGSPDEYQNVNSSWTDEYSDIYIRRIFSLTKEDLYNDYFIKYSHDDAIELYINGTLVVSEGGAELNLSRNLTSNQRTVLHEGNNTIAAHCHNDAGPAYVDFGLYAYEGSAPILYSGPVDILYNQTIHAYASKAGMSDSPVSEFIKNDYKVEQPEITKEWVGEGTLEVTLFTTKPNDKVEEAHFVYALREWQS